MDGVTYKLSILDTAGQDEFSAFREVYYRSGDGFILVCSFGDESSLREIRQFHSQVRRVREGKKITFSDRFSTDFTVSKNRYLYHLGQFPKSRHLKDFTS